MMTYYEQKTEQLKDLKTAKWTYLPTNNEYISKIDNALFDIRIRQSSIMDAQAELARQKDQPK